MNANDPAFPITSSTGDPRDGVYCATGLTKREEFAKCFMAALIASGCSYNQWDVAKCSASYADTLIAELSKGESK